MFLFAILALIALLIELSPVLLCSPPKGSFVLRLSSKASTMKPRIDAARETFPVEVSDSLD